MQLKDYQEIAIKELLSKSKKLLGYSGTKKLVFKAPTGSGKTIMMAEFLKRLVDDREVKAPLSFIWTAPRKLHEQSRSKLEAYFEDTRALKCSFFEDLDDIKISENEVLFFNWESINKENAIYIRENETNNNLSNVLLRTKEEDRKIVLIIDESQYYSGAMDKKEEQAASKLKNDINADLTIEVSATPILKGDDDVNVQLEDVKEEGMIKKAVLLNPDFDNIFRNGKIESKLSEGTEELVIDTALKKRKELSASIKRKTISIR